MFILTEQSSLRLKSLKYFCIPPKSVKEISYFSQQHDGTCVHNIFANLGLNLSPFQHPDTDVKNQIKNQKLSIHSMNKFPEKRGLQPLWSTLKPPLFQLIISTLETSMKDLRYYSWSWVFETACNVSGCFKKENILGFKLGHDLDFLSKLKIILGTMESKVPHELSLHSIGYENFDSLQFK